MKTIKLAGNIVDEKDISSSTFEEVTFSSTILPANFKERFLVHAISNIIDVFNLRRTFLPHNFTV